MTDVMRRLRIMRRLTDRACVSSRGTKEYADGRLRISGGSFTLRSLWPEEKRRLEGVALRDSARNQLSLPRNVSPNRIGMSDLLPFA
jgi:hypothetical protein